MIDQFIVEQAALDWLCELGYKVLYGPTIGPGETTAERADYKQLFIFARLQAKEALQKTRLISHSTPFENNSAFHRLLVSDTLRASFAQVTEVSA